MSPLFGSIESKSLNGVDSQVVPNYSDHFFDWMPHLFEGALIIGNFAFM